MFKYILKKEFLLIFRDIHALLVLFVMPTLFILIMSLALQDINKDVLAKPYKVGLVTENIEKATILKTDIDNNKYFESAFTEPKNKTENLLYSLDYDFIISIDSEYKTLINSNNSNFEIIVLTMPNISSQYTEMLKQIIIESISKEIMNDYFIEQRINAKTLSELNQHIKIEYSYKNGATNQIPNSVQQSVPAWLVFSMFFILIPISNTFINEKNFGTLARIKSINVPLLPILIGKIIPYYIINQFQVVLMFLVGIYVVPALGGDTLEIKSGYWLLFCMSSMVSLAAISFALFVANISKTSEEATSIGGVSNIILAAVGGIMVPKFIMPEFMQDISSISPMSWALDGFLELLLKGGGFVDISSFMIYLSLFSILFFILAFALLNKKVHNK